jgi:uncharacterized protein YjbI with pentapeptide repeats
MLPAGKIKGQPQRLSRSREQEMKKRNKKQPMPTASQTPSSNAEPGDFSLQGESGNLEDVLARVPEGLVPADQLPSAADALAALFPPEESSSAEAAPSSHAPIALADAEAGDATTAQNALTHANSPELLAASDTLDASNPPDLSNQIDSNQIDTSNRIAPSNPPDTFDAFDSFQPFDPAVSDASSDAPPLAQEVVIASVVAASEFPEDAPAQSVEAAFQNDAPPDVAVLAANGSLSTGQGSLSHETHSAPHRPKNNRQRKKSMFSGLASASEGFFQKIAAVFAGDPRQTVSTKLPSRNEAHAQDERAELRSFETGDSHASGTASVDVQHPTGRVAGDSSATPQAVLETELPLASHSPNLALNLVLNLAPNLDVSASGGIGNLPASAAEPSGPPRETIHEHGTAFQPPYGANEVDQAGSLAGERLAFSGSAEPEPFTPESMSLSQDAGSLSQDRAEPEAEESAEEEAVDTLDDDLAIAAAIERFANLNVPVRSDVPLGPRIPDVLAESDSLENGPAHRHVIESVAGAPDLNAILDIPRDADPAGSPADSWQPSSDPAAQIATGGVAPDSSQYTEVASALPPRETSAHEASSSEEFVGAEPAPERSPRDWSFEEKLASHHEWIESKGAVGKRIDFAASDLEGNDLIGVNLRYIDLHDSNLRAADLLMADLRDACLVRVSFRDSCLVGANLEGANLEGAILETSMGLVPHQLAGANLHDATLPPNILQFEALPEFKRASRTVHGYFVAMMSLSALSWLIVWMTKDFQLVTNSAILRFLHSPAAAAALPTGQFYLIAPFALFIVYLVFHFHLQHLWDTVLELPAVFPDGRTLGENAPRIVVGLLRTHFRWMNQDAPSTRFIERAISILLAYWIVPVTLLFYWLRYLTLQEMQGTIFHEFLVVGAAGAALYSTTKVGRPAAKWALQQNPERNVVERALGRLREIDPVKTALVLLAFLTFISAGTMVGVPHGKDRAPQFWAGSIRRWAPTVLWSVGVDPYADLTEAVISTKPANWNGSDEQVSAVTGARLNDSNFRYAQAYRVFLANAHLLHAKFQGAFLSQADLRGADLGQSDLRYAVLDQAQMSHANLDRAMLDGANLSRSDLRASNLSYASISGASLVDARVDGASLYGAKLFSSTMIRTNFEKADLREAHLNNANLEHVDMQGAYLWSAKLPGAHLNNAQLGTAIFVDADLRGADLRWAQLPGTVLTGADLTGAALDGADFRTAVGFGANQICSARSRKGLLLDEAMQAQVTAQCGAGN